MATRVVVMGVAGSGKTAVGRRLAKRLHGHFIEADDLHPAANIAKMASGTPLTDADRWPWLEDLVTELAASDVVVATCSALKRSYRDVLRRAGDVWFVHLDVERDVVLRRVTARSGHFMSVDMVESQFATLEAAAVDECDVIRVTGTRSVNATTSAALAALRSAFDNGTPSPPDV